jgi:iron transport multicopper oxidase
VVPPTLNANVTGWLVYDDSAKKPSPTPVDAFSPFDDFTLVPHDGMELLEDVDYSFNLDLAMNNLGDGAN